MRYQYTILAICIVTILWSPLAFILGYYAHKRKEARRRAGRRPMSESQVRERLEPAVINLKPEKVS